MAIRQITIIGTGLIGSSFGLALKKRRFPGRIIGCDRAPVLGQARNKGAIDEGHTDPAGAVPIIAIGRRAKVNPAAAVCAAQH